MSQTLTTKLIEETLTFLETTFRGELSWVDTGLALGIHVIIGLLFVIPAISAFLAWFRKTVGVGGRREVLVCAECRVEVHEHCVRCPSCSVVYPSSFLRALLTLGVLALAYWTAQLYAIPLAFWGLIAVYGVLIGSVVAFTYIERMRAWRPAQVVHGLVGRCVDATVKGREMWRKGEALLRMALVLAFYGSLIFGLHRYGLPMAQDEAGLADVLTKLTFVCLLLAFTSLAVLISQLRRFQGFATLVLALCSFLFFTLGALGTHTTAGFIRMPPPTAPSNWVLSAFHQKDGRLALRYRDASGHDITALATVEDPKFVRFSTSLLIVERFGYRRYFLKEVIASKLDGALPASPVDRAARLGFWGTVWDPPVAIYHFYVLAMAEEKADWVRSLEAKVDPQDPRVWKVPVAVGKDVDVFIDGIRIYYQVRGTEVVQELERF